MCREMSGERAVCEELIVFASPPQADVAILNLTTKETPNETYSLPFRTSKNKVFMFCFSQDLFFVRFGVKDLLAKTREYQLKY